MSLKAKIEAVIYASEEPVTLAQLIGLLAEEAQAELDAFASQQQLLALDDLSSPDFPVPDQDALESETSGAEASAAESSARPDSSQPPREDAGGESAADEATAPPAAANDKALAAAAKQKDRRLREHFRSLLDELIADYASETRGLEIREVAGGFRLATKPEYHDAVRGFVKGLKPPLKLTLQALETLAVVAYKQPVTSPEVSEIRGVDSAGVLGSLMARKLGTTAGRKQVIGRPILYKTTKDFLMRFGLKDINELPSIEEFEKMAGELNAAVQEEIPMEKSPEPARVNDDAPEDLRSDRSIHSEDHDREHADRGEAEPLAEGADGQQSNLRAEDGDARDIAENVADEVVIDGRMSGLPPSYAEDSPSAAEAREQEEEQGE
jgi:segregation and condensation protein B